MLSSKLHEYRGHFVKVSYGRSFPALKYTGGYVITNTVHEIVAQGQTAIVSNQELAQQLALSLALQAIDLNLRSGAFKKR